MKPAPSLLPLVTAYLAHRRSLGYLLCGDEKLLREFAAFVAATGLGRRITTAIAVQWACQRPASQARRLSVVRMFARFCTLTQPGIEIPPPGLVGPYLIRRPPHLYTSAQVRLILQRCRTLSCRRSPLRADTFATFVGLLACTGLRSGEARRLRCRDFDPQNGTLLVPATKWSPQRLLPLHPSAVRALVDYQRTRRRLVPGGEHFFVGPHGRALDRASIAHTFAKVVRGIKSNGVRPRPRPHDFRHTFATRWIAEWSRQSAPLTHHLLRLSVYLGHRDLAATWWYVSADAAALDHAAQRFARYRHGRSPDEA